MTVMWFAVSGTAAATSIPTPTRSAVEGPTTLTWGQTLTALVVMGAVLLLAGAVVIWGRQSGGHVAGGGKARSDKGRPQFEAGPSVLRSWIAISLVISAF
jgi:hypothetical protein